MSIVNSYFTFIRVSLKNILTNDILSCIVSAGGDRMNMTEAANFIEILRALGWTGDQIADFQLGIEGRITVEEATKRVKEVNDLKNKTE